MDIKGLQRFAVALFFFCRHPGRDPGSSLCHPRTPQGLSLAFLLVSGKRFHFFPEEPPPTGTGGSLNKATFRMHPALTTAAAGVQGGTAHSRWSF